MRKPQPKKPEPTEPARKASLKALAIVGGTMLSIRLLLEQRPCTADDWGYVISKV